MVLSLDRRIISQKPDAIPALMRARRDRPGDCGAADERDELAPSQVDHATISRADHGILTLSLQ